MTAYNGVNGIAASENKLLLDEILRKEWNWDGMIMSDWTGKSLRLIINGLSKRRKKSSLMCSLESLGTYSTAEAILAGLDIEMPGPSLMRGACVKRQIGGGKLTISDIDTRVRKVNFLPESFSTFEYFTHKCFTSNRF